MSTPLLPLVPGNLSHFLLWMGDSGLATLVVGAVALCLALRKQTRGLAWLWAGAFVLVSSLVFATKLGIFGWGDGFERLDFRGPSGHATVSAFVWPMVAWLLTMHAGRSVRVAAYLLGAAFAMGIAWILVAYSFHSLPEVVAGSLLGGGASVACIAAARFSAPAPRHITVLAALVIALLFGLQHGTQLGPLVRFKAKAHQLVATDNHSAMRGGDGRSPGRVGARNGI
ncbi:hypothetical protein [Variovorax boronicumulans]|uniref:hypothetical protein n=1 Tax=Variovorax boronicumulans TaxID=436515 RepID=UPI001C58171F